MKRAGTRIKWSLAAVMAAAWLLLPGIPQAATVSLEADSQLLVGQSFDVALSVDAISNVYGIACDLVYDPSYLEVVDLSPGSPVQPQALEGSFFSNNGADNTVLRAALEDDTPGVLVLGLSRTNTDLEVSATEPTNMAWVTFKAVSAGATNILFQDSSMLNASKTAVSVDSWKAVNLDVDNPPVITEGSVVTVTMSEDASPIAFSLTLHATDADGDALTWDVSEGAQNGQATAGGTGSSVEVGYVPDQDYNGADSFRVAAFDGKWGYGYITVNTVINPVNDPPLFSSSPITSAVWSVPYSYGITVADVDAGDVLTITCPTKPAWLAFVDNGNGTATLSGTAAFDDMGDHSVSLAVVDSGSTTDAQNFTITVRGGFAPTVSINSVTSANEGDPVDFSATVTDQDPGDSATLVWNFGDGTAPVTADEPTHAFADNGSYQVMVTATDMTGKVATDTQTLTIANAAPVVDAGQDMAAYKDAPVLFAGSFTDAGSADTHAFSWDFGDGSPLETGSLVPEHTYSATGIYTATLTVTDDDSAQGSDAITIRVIDRGDINGDGVIDLSDAVLMLRVLTNTADGQPIYVAEGEKLGLQDVLHVLQVIALGP